MGRLSRSTIEIEKALDKAETSVQSISINGEPKEPDASGNIDLGYCLTKDEIAEELTPRNVGAVDPAGEVDDTISLATTEYVDTAITTAITTTLNTPV